MSDGGSASAPPFREPLDWADPLVLGSYAPLPEVVTSYPPKEGTLRRLTSKAPKHRRSSPPPRPDKHPPEKMPGSLEHSQQLLKVRAAAQRLWTKVNVTDKDEPLAVSAAVCLVGVARTLVTRADQRLGLAHFLSAWGARADLFAVLVRPEASPEDEKAVASAVRSLG